MSLQEGHLEMTRNNISRNYHEIKKCGFKLYNDSLSFTVFRLVGSKLFGQQIIVIKHRVTILRSGIGFLIVLVGVGSKSFQPGWLVLHCHQVRALPFGIFEDFHLLLPLQSVPVSCIVLL